MYSLPTASCLEQGLSLNFWGPHPLASQAQFLQSLPGHVHAKVLKIERGWAVPLGQLSKCVILNFRDSWHKCVCLPRHAYYKEHSANRVTYGGTHV